jgi:hypothetical protein
VPQHPASPPRGGGRIARTPPSPLAIPGDPTVTPVRPVATPGPDPTALTSAPCRNLRFTAAIAFAGPARRGGEQRSVGRSERRPAGNASGRSPALAAVASPSLPARHSGGSPRTLVANAPTGVGETPKLRQQLVVPRNRALAEASEGRVADRGLLRACGVRSEDVGRLSVRSTRRGRSSCHGQRAGPRGRSRA